MKHVFLLFLIGVIAAFELAAEQTHDIRLGSASMEIKVHGPKDSVGIFKPYLMWQEIFDNSLTYSKANFDYNGDGNYTLNIPVETTNIIGVVAIINQSTPPECYAAGTVELTQGDTLVLDCNFTNQGFTAIPSSNDGFNRYSFMPGKSLWSFISKNYSKIFNIDMHGITNQRKIYNARDSAWREVLRQTDAVYQPILTGEVNYEGIDSRDSGIIKSNVAYYVYGTQYVSYDDMRKQFAPYGNRDVPPLEYYDFLNLIDFSHLISPLPYYSPYLFLARMLLYLPLGLEPIGEMPVREWQRQTAEKLGQVINEVPDILPRLLSATSYGMQLDMDKKPLTPTQIKNISEGYDDDLGKIILNKNEQLNAELDNAAAS